MDNITAYNKFIVAIIMAVYNIINQAWGIEIPGLADEATTTAIVNTILAIAVALVPNKPKVS